MLAAGTTTYPQRAVQRLNQPLGAAVSLHDEGLRIHINNAETLQPEDVILASTSPDRMAVRREGDEFRSEPADVLAEGTISKETLLDQTQVLRADQYASVFRSTRLLGRFPDRPTLFFWTRQFEPTLRPAEDDYRTLTSTLVSLPIDLQVPPADVVVTIPPTLLPYYLVPDTDGAISSAYNTKTGWAEKELAGRTVLKFDLPEQVRPFEFEDSELQLRILAGSRTVKVETGRLHEMSEVDTLESPVTTVSIRLPAESLNDRPHGDSVLLRISVSALQSDGGTNKLNVEQDDVWKIERVLLTVRGRRVPGYRSEPSEL